MKKVEYYCDLCKEKKPNTELRALYWKCDIIPQKFIITPDLNASDKHICNDCTTTVKEN